MTSNPDSMPIPDMNRTVALLAAEGERLGGFLAGLDAAGWAQDSACDGWTVADVAAHLAQGSGSSAIAIARARAGDSSPPEGQRLLDRGERASALTAERAIDFRRGLAAADLLAAFNDSQARLVQAARAIQAGEWEMPSFHRRGIIPLHENVARRIQELVIHGWDIRSAFDPLAPLSEEAAGLITTLAHRWLHTCFVPVAGAAPARFRFQVSGLAPVNEDVVLEGDGFRIESAGPDTGEESPDVTFRCDASSYVLLIYGRLDLEAGPIPARLEIDGPAEKARLFTGVFRGY